MVMSFVGVVVPVVGMQGVFFSRFVAVFVFGCILAAIKTHG